jgi:GTP:adenosylcobinamide-phosphate guanylyltransferase
VNGAALTAFVLAGERAEGDPMARAAGVALKAMLPVAGRPMLTRVTDALRETPMIARIVVSIPRPALAEELGIEAIMTEASPSLSVVAAIDRLPGPLLVTTADHALLTSEIVQRFVDLATTGNDADLVVGVVERATVERLVPGTRRTYWRFTDGAYSGANLFLLRTPRARAAVAFWRRVETQRKRPWQIARAFGPKLLLGYLFGRFSLEAAMAQASDRLGCRVRAVALPFAEAAIDVDKPADLALVESLLLHRQNRAGRQENPQPAAEPLLP